MKDYYLILNVKPDASVSVIKQSYRKLAMKYHPDLNAGDTLSASVFSEIAEAYSILSDPLARKDYNNKRYFTAISEYAKPEKTIDDLLNKAVELKNKISFADSFRFNRDALEYSIRQLFPSNISALLQADVRLQEQFLEIVISCCRMLTSHQTKNLMQLMMPLLNQHNRMRDQLQTIIKEQIKKERWDKYKTALALIIALILCFLIFLITNI